MTAMAPAATDALHIPCPECQTVVRVPHERLGEHPKCPRCKAAILGGQVLTLEEASFATQVGRSDLPVLVDFWAPWCGPCRMMAPVLERAAAEWATHVRVGKVNTDEQPALGSRFGIRSIPTLILFQGGREAGRQSGAVDSATLRRWVEATLARR